MIYEIDILEINSQILSKFDDEYSKLSTHKIVLSKLKETLNLDISKEIREDIVSSITNLQNNITNIILQTDKNFYLIETAKIINEYELCLKVPVKVNFIGKYKKNDEYKNKIIKNYLNIIRKYNNVYYNVKKEKQKEIICSNPLCVNKKNFEIVDDNMTICLECGSQQEVFIHTTSYRDSDRVNITVKYTYDRRVHFKDCINQYQGKQNCFIENEVYDKLEDQFEKHHLLVEGEEKKSSKRFSKITKNHIQIFLRELEFTKHYENVNLIHYNLTEIKPDDISHLEDQLLCDFDKLTNIYDKLYKNKTDRKNFINTQHCLYQLLKRHKHNCNKEDFTVLKTIERKTFHDMVSSRCFEALGWTYEFLF